MKLRCFCITCKMEGGEGRLGWSIWTGEARMASRLTLGHSSHGWRQGTCGLGHYDGMIHFICVKRLLCVWLAVCCRVNRPPCPGSGETHSHNISRCPCLQPPGVRWKSPCKHGSAFPQCKGHRGGSGVGSLPPAALLLRGRRVPPTRGLSQHPVTWRGHGLAPRGPRFHRWSNLPTGGCWKAPRRQSVQWRAVQSRAGDTWRHRVTASASHLLPIWRGQGPNYWAHKSNCKILLVNY